MANVRSGCVTKIFRFEAAHNLPNHNGKCRGLHGHSYQVEVIAQGKIHPVRGEPDDGMVLDFAEISSVWKGCLEPKLDHKYLNESLAMECPTAEHIALWILEAFRDAGIHVATVRLHETTTGYVEVAYESQT